MTKQGLIHDKGLTTSLPVTVMITFANTAIRTCVVDWPVWSITN